MSINDDYETNKLFYDTFKDTFKNNIKCIYINKYIIPTDFFNVNIDNKNLGDVYLKTLSCFYNDKKCYELANEFELANSLNYDLYLRFRSDIIVEYLPNFDNYDKDTLYCVKPPNFFTLAVTDNPEGEYKNGRRYCYGNIQHNGIYVTGDIAYGNKKLIKKYCNCYEYILEQNKINNGNYFICFEYNLTTYLYDININWKFFDNDYKYESNRYIK